MTATVIAAAAFAVFLVGCASAPSAPGPTVPASPPTTAPATPAAPAAAGPLARYRCDQDIAFTVRFDNGSAVIDAGARGSETLLRDAGGVTPQQTVYSSTSMKAEFGLEPEGRGARLTYVLPPLEAKCVRD